MADDQRQRSGANSENVQIGSVTINANGVSVADVIAISDEISQRNIEKYAAASQATVNGRTSQLSVKIAMTLEERGRLESAADPGMQYSILTAQRDYARSGDEAIAENLVNLLADRSLETERNRRQLTIDEAIQVAGRLSIDQMNLLALVLFMRRPRPIVQVANIALFEARVEMDLLSLSDLITASHTEIDLDLGHAAYAGCVSITEGNCSVASGFWQVYSGCFTRGFTSEDLPNYLRDREADRNLFIPCLRDPARMQVNAMSAASAVLIAEREGVDSTEYAGMLDRFRMSEEEITADLVSRGDKWGRFVDHWDDTKLQHAELTPVGIAIAQANAVRVLGQQAVRPLSAWL